MIVTVQRSDGKTFFNIQQQFNSGIPCLFSGSVEASWNIETKDFETVNDLYEKVEDVTRIRLGGFKIFFLGVLLDDHLDDNFEEWLELIQCLELDPEFDFIQHHAGPEDEKWLIIGKLIKRNDSIESEKYFVKI